jgi:hypothetical protein
VPSLSSSAFFAQNPVATRPRKSNEREEDFRSLANDGLVFKNEPAG